MNEAARQITENPQFHTLSVPDRVARLSAVDPEFRSLPDTDKNWIVGTLESRFRERGPAAAGQGGPTASGSSLPDLKDVSIGFRSGVADLAHSMANAANLVGLSGVGSKIEGWAKSEAPAPQETQGREGMLHQIVQGVGAAPAGIVKYAPAIALRRFAPLGAAVIGAVSEADKGGEAAAEAALRDAGSFYLMGKAGGIQSRPVRALASAGAAAAPAALETGGDPKATTAAAILGGVMGGVAPPTPPGLKKTPSRVDPVVKSLKDDFQAALNPAARGTPGKQTAVIMRANLGAMKQRLMQISEEFAGYRDRFEGMLDKGQRDQVFDLVGKIETGSTTALPAEDQAFAQAARKVMDQQWRELHSRKLVDTYIEDYFPRMWDRSEQAGKLFATLAKRPFEGAKGFAKQRAFVTLKEGIDFANAHPELGLKLVSENPVDLLYLKIREGQRAILAHDVMQEMKQNGLLKFNRSGRPPAGYAEIRDKAFTKMFKNSDGMWVQAGKYYAPEPAARVINNYLSPGLRDRPWFRGYMDLANSMNQFQLGFSFFHLGFSTIDAMTSNFSLGVEKMVHGMRTGSGKAVLSGAGDVVTAPYHALEPIVGGWMGKGKTNQIWDEYVRPGSQPQEVQNLVQAMKDSGFQLQMDPMYRTEFRKKLRVAMRNGDTLGAMFHGANRIGEWSSKFIMEYAVPRQKVAAFGRMAEFELSRLPQNATQEQVRATMQKVLDSVDNRLGQLAYDNLFWNRAARDLLMASVRSVGWNFGTFRELLGGAADWGAFAKQAVTPGVKAEFTHRMAYTVSLPVLIGTLGGITNYLMTGEHPQGMDYFFPRTGQKDEYGRDERVSFPSYLKDVYHYGAPFVRKGGGVGPGIKGVVKTVTGKMHPQLAAIAEMLQNEDYFGTKIRNEDDPAMRQIIDTGMFLANQFQPFTLRYLSQGGARGGVAGFFGITPAPADIKESDTELFINRYYQENPRGSRTRATAERQKQIREMEKRARLGEDIQPYADQQMAKGTITEKDIATAEQRSKDIPLVRKFDSLPWQSALGAYEIAVKDSRISAEELELMHESLEKKVNRNLDEIIGIAGNPKRQQEMRNRLTRLGLPTDQEATPPPTPPGM